VNAVLDASALVAYIDAEPGGDVVADLLMDPNVTCYAHAFNLCEVYYNVVRNKDRATAQQTIADLRSDGVVFRRDLSLPFWQAVGDLKATGGISLPDCVCVILAQYLGAEAVTADHGEFDKIVPMGFCSIRFIR
jgi:PIN domain nuclease of toxin-antitoxin system